MGLLLVTLILLPLMAGTRGLWRWVFSPLLSFHHVQPPLWEGEPGGSAPPPEPGPPAPDARRGAAAIIPARNEEAVIEATLLAALRVFHRDDIYLFADGCTDRTVEIARRHLPPPNVIDHPENIGKSRGLLHTLEEYIYPRQYEYVSIIDADAIVEDHFLSESLRALGRKKVACAVGQVKSYSYGETVFGVYRVFMYFMWQAVVKRVQGLFNAMTIASGTSSTWKTSILRQLEFDHRLSTEDFSLTMQVHRRRLGKIAYVHSAVVWTQEPFTLRSYWRQCYRWSRAWWEAIRKYRVGFKWFRMKWGFIPTGISAMDVGAAVLVLSIYTYWLRLATLPVLVIFPLDVGFEFFFPSTRDAVLTSMALQYGTLVAPFILVSVFLRKWLIILFLPLMVGLAVVDLLVSLVALASVMRSLYRRGPRGSKEASVWVSPERERVSPAA